MPTFLGRLLRETADLIEILRETADLIENTLRAGLALFGEAVARWRGTEEPQRVLPLRTRRPVRPSTAAVNSAPPAPAGEADETHDG